VHEYQITGKELIILIIDATIANIVVKNHFHLRLATGRERSFPANKAGNVRLVTFFGGSLDTKDWEMLNSFMVHSCFVLISHFKTFYGNCCIQNSYAL
jgi:hypothetical protein